jgi:hypothetical protein
MSLVVHPSARERFTPRDLVAAYEDFLGSEPQYVDAETGIKASAYLFGAGVLLVYEESEADVVVLCSPECVEGEFSEVRGRDGTAHRSMAAFVQEAPHKRNRR